MGSRVSCRHSMNSLFWASVTTQVMGSGSNVWRIKRALLNRQFLIRGKLVFFREDHLRIYLTALNFNYYFSIPM